MNDYYEPHESPERERRRLNPEAYPEYYKPCTHELREDGGCRWCTYVDWVVRNEHTAERQEKLR